MDISTLTAITNELVIVHPKTAEPIGLTIDLLPMTSEAVKAVQRRMTNESLRSRGKALTAEKLDATRLDILVAATSGWTWDGDATFHGEKPEATPVLIRKVYKELPWVKEQVDNALNDEAAFFRGDQ